MSPTDNINSGNGNQGKKIFPGAPEGYFDSFVDQLRKKIELEELRENAPFLSGVKKTELFTVPAGYFDTLHLRIRESFQNDQRKIFRIFTRKQVGVSLGIAASVALFVIFLIPFSQDDVQLADVPAKEIEQFVTDEIESSVRMDDLPGIENLALNTSFVNAEPEEIENYIIEEIELSEIIDEL